MSTRINREIRRWDRGVQAVLVATLVLALCAEVVAILSLMTGHTSEAREWLVTAGTVFLFSLMMLAMLQGLVFLDARKPPWERGNPVPPTRGNLPAREGTLGTCRGYKNGLRSQSRTRIWSAA